MTEKKNRYEVTLKTELTVTLYSKDRKSAIEEAEKSLDGIESFNWKKVRSRRIE